MARSRLLACMLAASVAACSAPRDEQTTLGDAAPTSDSDPLGTPGPGSLVHPGCALPNEPTTIRTDGAAVLLSWEFPAIDVYTDTVLPPDSAFLDFRARVRADGADLRRPISDAPTPQSDDEARMWADEDYNNELAQSGQVGTIEPISCLDALLFAYQHNRFSQLENPTEFIASVLTKEVAGEPRLAVIFGAGSEMFPPKSVYGFDIVDEYRSQGWRHRYAIHNHTIQANGDRLALGSPVLSTSDVQLMKNLVEGSGLETGRVTNGFYTFSVDADEIGLMRSR